MMVRLLVLFDVKENLEHYPILLPVELCSDDPLAHLRLHNGTIWRWNRPLIGYDESGEPHLRIEQRVIPAGPTPLSNTTGCHRECGILLWCGNSIGSTG